MFLKVMLPPTAFTKYIPSLAKDHPSVVNTMDIDQPQPLGDTELNSNIFTDPHLLAAAHTFQDHLHSDWLSKKHIGIVNKFEAGVRDGSLAAPWKDETWERENATPAVKEDQSTPLRKGASVSSARAGSVIVPCFIYFYSRSAYSGATEIKLNTLAEHRIIRVGDVISYKRHFSVLDVVVEKDVIVSLVSYKPNSSPDVR